MSLVLKIVKPISILCYRSKCTHLAPVQDLENYELS